MLPPTISLVFESNSCRHLLFPLLSLIQGDTSAWDHPVMWRGPSSSQDMSELFTEQAVPEREVASIRVCTGTNARIQ
jgi:hypothetical protein